MLLQTADGSDDAQMKQVESLLTQGIDVLVIVPHNAEVAGAMVEMAKRQGVPVISYDRLVRNSEPDLYVSFDNGASASCRRRCYLRKSRPATMS